MYAAKWRIVKDAPALVNCVFCGAEVRGEGCVDTHKDGHERTVRRKLGEDAKIRQRLC